MPGDAQALLTDFASSGLTILLRLAAQTIPQPPHLDITGGTGARIGAVVGECRRSGEGRSGGTL